MSSSPGADQEPFLSLRGLDQPQLDFLAGFLAELDGCAEESFEDGLDQIELFRKRAERELAGIFRGRARTSADHKLLVSLNLLADLWRQGELFMAKPGEDTKGAGLDFFFRAEGAGEGQSSGKERTRRQLLGQRREQLRESATQGFIRKMETARYSQDLGETVSIYNLMRDGEELADGLAEVGLQEGAAGLAELVRPYLQPIRDSKERCEHTGLLLTDIWRYFRHTWASPRGSTPGRSMQILIRDAAAKFHPVVGVAALSSAALKLRARDQHIGWDGPGFLARLRAMWDESSGKGGRPTRKGQKLSRLLARWIEEVSQQGLDELYLVDLINEGIIDQAEVLQPGPEFARGELRSSELEERAETLRNQHLAEQNKAELHGAPKDGDWEARAKTPLFKGKRILALLELLRIRHSGSVFLTEDGAELLLDGGRPVLLYEDAGQEALRRVLAKACSRSVGTQIADISVCGAVPPYNHLLGSKLVSMLVASPEVLEAYRERYGESVSQIDSSKAGRPIIRSSDLVFLSTSSLYNVRPCQYDRLSLRLPTGGGSIRYRLLRHLSKRQVARLAESFLRGLRDALERLEGYLEGAAAPYLQKEQLCATASAAETTAGSLRQEFLLAGVIRWDSSGLAELEVGELTKKRRQELARELTQILHAPCLSLLGKIPGIEDEGELRKLSWARQVALDLLDPREGHGPVDVLYQALLDFSPGVLGRSGGVGTVQFSQATTDALRGFLDCLSREAATREGSAGGDPEVGSQHRRAFSVFGEGTSPKMRLVRDGVSKLGALHPDELMCHGQQRLCYGAGLVENMLDYLLGLPLDLSMRLPGKGTRLLDSIRPRYSWGELSAREGTELVIEWWLEKKLLPRLTRDGGLDRTLSRLREESLDHPIRHGARVLLPPMELEVALAFD